MNVIKQVEDMPVYQHFYELALRVANCTRAYPNDFNWLRLQSLRSSESVPANMTEGFYSQYSTEYLQCLFRCRREARETMTHLKYARDVTLLPSATVEDIVNSYEETLGELSKLIASIERKVRSHGKAKPNAVREEPALYQAEA
ncbi:MAG: four helix bundle protein [Verrucomicrobia bacterium]|nr:four helix bundle protein [Verrucomicrobiota bacterium]